MIVKFKLDGVEYVVDVEKEMEINVSSLDEERIKHASRRAWLGVASVRYKVHAERLYHELKILKAKLAKEYRSWASQNQTRVTESMVEENVLTDERYLNLLEEYFEVSKIAEELSKVERAYDDRKDMLLEISRDRREEMRLDRDGL